MENIGLVALQIITLAIMLVGLLSLFTLVVPGLVIIWVGALIYALILGLNWPSGILFGFITVLMLVGNLVDNLMMGAGARQKGASWLSIGVALIAAVVGTLAWPPFGGLLAALAGILIVELIRLKEMKKAWESLKGMASGCGWAFVIRFLIGVIMIFWWLVWAFLLPYLGA
jgi:uncharacterized protein YqgC (DUF456 family)